MPDRLELAQVDHVSQTYTSGARQFTAIQDVSQVYGLLAGQTKTEPNVTVNALAGFLETQRCGPKW